MNWIKCSERLPDTGKTIWFMHKNDGKQLGYRNPYSYYSFTTAMSYRTLSNITHWQYVIIPEPPKE